MQPGHNRNQSCTYTTTCDGVISSVGNTSLPAKHAHFSEMSGVTPRVQVGAPPTQLLCAGDPASWGPGSGAIRNSGTGAQAGPRRVSSLARCTAATASSGSASPRAPGAQCHGGSWSRTARRRSDLRPLGRAAARLRCGGYGRRAGERGAGRGRRTRAALRRRAPQSQGPLTTSFFHSQKKQSWGGVGGKGKKKRKKKSHPGTVAVTGTAHSGAQLVERGAKGIGHPEATP